MFFSDRRPGNKDFSRKLVDARRKGVGLYLQDWQVESPDDTSSTGLVESLLTWCRETLAGCRRPYGIDHFDLDLVFKAGGAGDVRRLAFERLRPIELYMETFPERLATLVSRETPSAGERLYISAGLFSWGEAAHHALPQST